MNVLVCVKFTELQDWRKGEGGRGRGREREKASEGGREGGREREREREVSGQPTSHSLLL